MGVKLEKSLFVVLDTQPWCALLQATEQETNSLYVRGERFSLIEEQAGFYDFLRNEAGMVIGLRYSTFSNQAILIEAMMHNNTTVDLKRQYLEVCIREERVIPGRAEQGFGDDSIWQNSTGTYAVLVGTSDLSDEDVSRLESMASSAC